MSGSVDSHWTLARLMVKHCPRVVHRGEEMVPAERPFTYWMSQRRSELERLLTTYGEPDESGIQPRFLRRPNA